MWSYCTSFARATIRKDYKLGGLNNRNVSSQFWKLEVQDQGISGVGVFWLLREKLCSMLLSWLLVACWPSLAFLGLQKRPGLHWPWGGNGTNPSASPVSHSPVSLLQAPPGTWRVTCGLVLFRVCLHRLEEELCEDQDAVSCFVCCWISAPRVAPGAQWVFSTSLLNG